MDGASDGRPDVLGPRERPPGGALFVGRSAILVSLIPWRGLSRALARAMRNLNDLFFFFLNYSNMNLIEAYNFYSIEAFNFNPIEVFYLIEISRFSSFF